MYPYEPTLDLWMRDFTTVGWKNPIRFEHLCYIIFSTITEATEAYFLAQESSSTHRLQVDMNPEKAAKKPQSLLHVRHCCFLGMGPRTCDVITWYGGRTFATIHYDSLRRTKTECMAGNRSEL